MKISDLRITTRLVASYTLLLLLLLVVGGAGIWSITRLGGELTDIVTVDAKEVEYVQRSRANLNMLRRYEKDLFINIGDAAKVEEYRKKWDDTLELAHNRLDGLAKLAETSRERESIAAIRKQLDLYAAGFTKVHGQLKEGKITTTQEANKAMGEVKEAVHSCEKMIGDYAAATDKVMQEQLTSAQSYAATIRNLMYAIIGAAFLLTLLLSVVVARSIAKPLKEIQVMVRDMAQGEGDLTKRINYQSKDELGDICRTFNLFVEKLHGIIGRVAETTSQVATAAVQVHGTSEQMATGAEQVAAQAGTVATAGEEMAATSSDIAANCQLAAEGSKRANRSVQAGATVVERTIAVMGRIAERVRTTADAVGSLGARSDQIGAIVGTIEDIADQTNLLALNAAIEAARAGEQGRGFAVVADEVRALAERTTKATREIGEMIKTIQSETKGAVSAMVEGVNEVEIGTGEAAKSGEALREILDQINAVSMQVNQIATAAEEQTATTSEISGNMQQITEVVQFTSRGAQESATAAQRLSGLAEELQRIVGQFKLT
jgi:methyl-accepting chemotaxis protein